MPTECSAERFDFGMVEGRVVEAAFDAGLVTSDAGGLLLGAADRAIGLVDRFAACFRDHRRQDLIEHAVTTLIGQRVFGIALGYEELNDHDQLRHDPVLAVLAGKLSSTRETCAPVAGKSTLNRLELSREEPTRYHKIAYNEAAIVGARSRTEGEVIDLARCSLGRNRESARSSRQPYSAAPAALVATGP